jgi:hypothetical protein
VLERRRWICARASSGEWITGNSEFPGAKSRLGVNQPVRWSLSFCLQPKWRSVVSTDACLANTESDQSHLLPDGTIARRSGAGIGGKVRHGGMLCSRFYYVPYRFRCDVITPDFVQATQRRKIEPVLIPAAVIQSLAARSPTQGSEPYGCAFVYQPERQAVIEYMRAQGRACFVSPTFRGLTTVYDRLCEEQDVHDLETLATDLSFEFHCSATNPPLHGRSGKQ